MADKVEEMPLEEAVERYVQADLALDRSVAELWHCWTSNLLSAIKAKDVAKVYTTLLTYRASMPASTVHEDGKIEVCMAALAMITALPQHEMYDAQHDDIYQIFNLVNDYCQVSLFLK